MSGPFKRSGRPSREDEKRFGEVYEGTSQDLLAFLLRRSATAEDAADCLAETYQIAWEKRNRIPAGSEARPWLFGVARNVASRARTREERRAATSRELALAAKDSYSITIPEESAVTAALSELSPVDREIVTMLTRDGLAPREVATILGLSPNVVRVRAHRAREKLRSLLAESQPGGDSEPQDALPAATT